MPQKSELHLFGIYAKEVYRMSTYQKSKVMFQCYKI